MKKSIIAAALAGVVLLSGCSNVSEESYNSVVAENEKLKSENTSLQAQYSDSTSNSTSNSETDEYCMPKDHVRRIAKVLTAPESESYLVNHNTMGLDMKQYNIKSTLSIDSYKKNGKGEIKMVCFISSMNCTAQEKAAFVHYFFRLHMGEYVEKEFDNNNCENVVTVINDFNGDPIAVWLVYKKDGKIKHDMDIVDTDVLTALDEVMLNSDKWKPTENQITYPLPNSSNSESNINSQPTTSSSSAQSSTSQPTQSTQSPDTTTTGERNALKKAKSYLDTMPFSYVGLIEQLEYSGFTNSEATYGADNVGADWNNQALKKAKSYLDTMPFSYTGLIEQLEYNKFTHEQAVYGADKCGADWNEQAAKKAKSYLDIMAFSRDRLIEQLEYNGFTHEQAVYGAAQNGY